MVKYLHVRAIDEEGCVLPHGGVSVAYTTTPKDIVLQVALCHDNDLFCYRVGREIAKGRLQSKKCEATVIELKHPITQCICDWLAFEYFEVPPFIFLDDKGRWVSTFDAYETEVDTDWESQIKLEGDQACYAG